MSIELVRFPVQLESLTAAVDILLEMLPNLDVGVRQIDARATLLAGVPPADGRSAPRDALLARIGWSHADRLVAWYTLDGMAMLHSALSVRSNGAPLTVGRWLFGASSDAPPKARAELERVVAGGIPVPSRAWGVPRFSTRAGDATSGRTPRTRRMLEAANTTTIEVEIERLRCSATHRTRAMRQTWPLRTRSTPRCRRWATSCRWGWRRHRVIAAARPSVDW
jgi:hypothetical protein